MASTSSGVENRCASAAAATPSSSPPTAPISISMIVLAAFDFSSSSSAMSRFLSSAIAEPSHMCELNSGFWPFLTRSAPSSSSGRM